MVKRLPVYGLDPADGVDGDAVVVQGGKFTVGPVASSGGGGDFDGAAGRPARLVPYGVKLRGINIVSINMTGGATSDPWGQLFSDPANFDTVIKPQVDLAAGVGANVVRCIGGIGWVHNGQTTIADHVANYERFVDYCANLGLYVYACLSDASHWAGASKAQALAIFEPLADMLDTKANVIGIDVVQEIGLNFASISGGQSLHDWLADVLGDLRGHTTLPMTCSNTHSSNNTTAQWSTTTVAAVDDVVDFHDFHPYYDGMVPGDLAPVFTHTAKPVILGEYGAGVTEPTRTNRITAAAALYTLPQVVGSFYWALTDYNTNPITAWGLYDSSLAARSTPITAIKTVADRVGALPSAGHIVEDEGTVLPQRARLNITGAGVTATDNPTADSTDVAIPGATGLTVQDENSNVATGVTQIDFQGAGVAATAGSGEVVVTIGGGTSGGGELLMQDGVTGPPVPIETEARDDWLYQG